MGIKKDSVDYSLYLVTDRNILKGRDLFAVVEEAILGGVTLVQLREKELSSKQFYNTALKMKQLTSHYGIPLIINDRLDIMLAVDAEGLHIGQEDLPLQVARKIIGADKILGYSVSNLDEAKQGKALGADYLGAGPVYYTGTKSDAGKPIGLEELKRIKDSVKIPVVAIGGINETNAAEVKQTGVDGIAVVSAILGKQNTGAISRQLISLWKGN